MPRAAVRSNGYEVRSVRKALEILCAFSTRNPTLGVSQISRMLGLPKSTAHNLLRTLQGLQFLSQDENKKTFRLGPRLFELGLQVSQVVQLEAIARPYLHELREATKETVKLAVPSGRQALIAAAEESPYELHTRGDAGHRCPLHSTSLGKTILAFMPAAISGSLITQHGLPPITSHTITAVDKMDGELASIRNSGIAYDLEENEIGVCCAAAPVRDSSGKLVAALSVSGPTARISATRLRELATQVRKTAEEISNGLASVTTAI